LVASNQLLVLWAALVPGGRSARARCRSLVGHESIISLRDCIDLIDRAIDSSKARFGGRRQAVRERLLTERGRSWWRSRARPALSWSKTDTLSLMDII
jgi:hypothetical protein